MADDDSPVGEAVIVADGPEAGRFVRGRVSMPDITPDGELAVELPQLRELVAGEIDSYTMEKRMIRAGGGEPPYARGQMTDIGALKRAFGAARQWWTRRWTRSSRPAGPASPSARATTAASASAASAGDRPFASRHSRP